MFKRYTIRVKIFLGFLIVAIIATTIGVIGITQINKINSADEKLYNQVTLGLGQMANIAASYQTLRSSYRDMIDENAPDRIEKRTKEVDKFILDIQKNAADLAKTFETEDGKKIYQDFKDAFKDFTEDIETLKILASTNNDMEATMLKDGKLHESRLKAQAFIEKLLQYKIDEGKQIYNTNTHITGSANILMLIFIVIGLVLSLLAGQFLSKNINRILQHLIEQSQKLVMATKAGKLNVRADSDKINFEFREIAIGFNEALDAVTEPLNMAAKHVDRISKGDIPKKITEQYEGDFNVIKDNLNQCIDAINLLISDANMLAKAASKGELNTQAEEEKHYGDFKKIVEGMNNTLANVAMPFKFAADNIEKISIGELPAITNDVYQGEYANLKRSIDNLITSNSQIIEKAKLIAMGDLNVSLEKRSNNDELMISLNNLIQTLREIVNKVKMVAAGDLTISMEKRSDKDELMISLNDMVKRVANVIAKFQLATEQITQVSYEISSGAQQLSQGASEQASSSEEISSSMEEMASNIQQNTDNASQTEKIATLAATNIKKGNISTAKSASSMKDIAEKISIISEIAFQTNILALNAAVEAARAGEHGRGFAVVAAEVRKLAERSKVAADEINTVSREGVEIASRAGQQLEEIVPEIEKTSQLVQEIVAASIEQNSGADQINSSIQQLNKVTQQNASASEELATSSEELANQSEQLRELIDFFKISETTEQAFTSNTRQVYSPLNKHKASFKKPVPTSFLKNNPQGTNIVLSNAPAENKDSAFENY
jgi:methyl-accepting chemotaxis protein